MLTGRADGILRDRRRKIPPGCILKTMTAPATTAHYVATGMTCEHCRVAVIEEVTGVPGVASVDVDLAAGTVRVHGAGFDDAAVLAAIEEAGYEAVVA